MGKVKNGLKYEDVITRHQPSVMEGDNVNSVDHGKDKYPKQYGKEIRNEKNEIIRIEPNVEAIKEAAKAVKGWAPHLGYERTLEEEAKIHAQRALVPELFSISNAARAEAQATGGDYDTIYRNKINERTEELIQLYLTGVSPN